ncbi:thiol:disulfide interchange protein [Formosa agariphila KMM 3901]|uniref:Thiol:disulfide interchange protein n=1 Tax=Formosa agariphila (strain DSM 15362 / KCTC 12365 / LMG 23005 / KMM 3901 / M-2Alg 35-1) TaxID=1347342 RepID=T2KLM2_FORAG|nr:TlpA disulfide reductase family protein [Formosa agariphila]CDF79655.1 thiol:disulfide interchange protein [Formosa agariphila KMM 3901]
MFKKIALLGLVALAFSCAEEKNGFAINASFNDASNGKAVKLLKVEGQKQEVIDSTTITDGKAVFEGSVDSPDIYFIQIDQVRGAVPVIIENETMTVDINSDSIFNARVQGGKENKVFNTYQEYMVGLQKQNQALSTEFRTAQQSQDTALVAEIQARYMSMVDDNLAYDLDFMKKNNDAVVSVLILERHLANQKVSFEEKQSIYDNFTDDIKNTRVGKTIAESLAAQSATAVGSVVKDFSAPNPEGKTIALSDVKGKVTIIDFWAAWCGPCRKENPNLVKVYNKYNEKGLEILGVSLDGTPRQKDAKAEWIAAIEKDGLAWHQVSNLDYFNDPIAKQFNIQAIPATYILDAEGRIIASGLRGQALEDKIGQLLN